MADSYYQIATTPKLYVSYPLYQYASGALDEAHSFPYVIDGIEGYYDDDMLKLIQLDPSRQASLSTQLNAEGQVAPLAFIYSIVPSHDTETPVLESGLWNFDFCMFLGHTFNTSNIYPRISGGSQMGSVEIDTSNMVNYNVGSPPEYDGWSLISLNSLTPSDEHRDFRISFTGPEDEITNFNLGSILFGKSFEFPQNTTLATTTKFEYGIKQKSTLSGKTISTANWTKPNNWITEPFGLGPQAGDNYQRRSGRRVWKMSFDYLAPDKVMNQNMMMNSNNFTAQDNHSTAADGTSSLYNINNGNDFYTNVVHRSLSSHLPMILQIDKNDNSPSGYAIVRMKKDFLIKQKTPNLYSVTVTFIEQI